VETLVWKELEPPGQDISCVRQCAPDKLLLDVVAHEGDETKERTLLVVDGGHLTFRLEIGPQVAEVVYWFVQVMEDVSRKNQVAASARQVYSLAGRQDGLNIA